jgi:ribulose-phosphate 3-epimerase
MANIKISASILSADFSNLADQIHQAEIAGVDWIHIDVIDGHFAPNITMGPFIVETCRRITRLPLDVHLMIDQPERYIEAFAKAGADRISVHVENAPHVYRTLQSIRQLKCAPGVVLNPASPVCLVENVLPIVDLVLVMTVNPGFSGQEYIPLNAKIGQLKQMINKTNPSTLIQVDGGVTEKTLPAVVSAGADVIVAATAIFKHPQGIQAGVQALRSSIA